MFRMQNTAKSKIKRKNCYVSAFALFLINFYLLSTSAFARPKEAPAADAHARFVDTRFVNIETEIPGVVLDMRYASSNNFTGKRVPGYKAPVCLLSRPTAHALAKVQQTAFSQGYTLLIHDCYRPQQAVNAFVKWAKQPDNLALKRQYYPNEAKTTLFEKGYIAEKSGHSRGSTLDLTLLRRTTNHSGQPTYEPVDMGTPYDFFDPIANTNNPTISKTAQHNRQQLHQWMTEAGFKNLPEEWWHFTLINEPYPQTYFRFPVKAYGVSAATE